MPGSPLVAERTVALLRADERVDVSVLPAPSFLDLAWAALGIDPLAEGVRLVDAAELRRSGRADDGPFLVAQCWSRHLLSEVKLALGRRRWRPSRSRPVVLHHLGLDDEMVRRGRVVGPRPHFEPDHLTSSVPARSASRAGGRAGAMEVARLVALMDTLRGALPVGPRPDPRLAHATPGRGVLRGARRAGGTSRARAVRDVGDRTSMAREAFAHLEEELGDLLFQIVFHARLADEEGRFDLADVARGVHDKLVHRHPHVFGDVTWTSAERGRGQLGGDQEAGEGPQQRHRGHPRRRCRR